MPVINENYIQFFTAVCADWLPFILKNDECKDVIICALKYRVQTKEVGVAGFVIMPNYIHIIWRMSVEIERENLQRDFLKITAKQIIDILQKNEFEMIKNITVNLKDRKLQAVEKKFNEH